MNGCGKVRPADRTAAWRVEPAYCIRAWRQRIKLWLRVQDGFAGVEVYGHGNVVVDGQPAALSFAIALGEADPSVELLATEYRDLKIVAGDTVAFSCANLWMCVQKTEMRSKTGNGRSMLRHYKGEEGRRSR